MKEIIALLRFWVWSVVLNIIASLVFIKPISYWWILEIIILALSAIMVEWE